MPVTQAFKVEYALSSAQSTTHLVFLVCDLLQKVWHALAHGALEAAALEEGHDLCARAVVDDAALRHEEHLVKQVKGLGLGLQQGAENGGLETSEIPNHTPLLGL